MSAYTASYTALPTPTLPSDRRNTSGAYMPDMRRAVVIALDTCKGMAYLHRHGCVLPEQSTINKVSSLNKTTSNQTLLSLLLQSEAEPLLVQTLAMTR